MNVFKPTPSQLTPERELQTLVENRSIFTMANCEMNIYETYQPSEKVRLQFNDLVFTAMLRGKKVMHLAGTKEFDYLPGESVLLPQNEEMIIDFPEASLDAPAQCIALAIRAEKVKQVLELMEDQMDIADSDRVIPLQTSQFHIQNTFEITQTIDRLVKVSLERHPSKDIFADWALQELLMRVIQTQSRAFLLNNYRELSHKNRFAYVIEFIQNNLDQPLSVERLSDIACMSKPHFFRSFKQELGLSPVEYVISQRMNRAKTLLLDISVSLLEVSARCGFQSVTYFCTLFKKLEGVTPGQFRKMHIRLS